MSEWQPIETAPKDGTWIIGTAKDWQGGVVSMQWDSGGSTVIGGDYTGWVRRDPSSRLLFAMRNIKPTHWMPLPGLPA